VLNADKLRTQKSRAQITNADKAGARRVLVLDASGTADVKYLRVPEQPTTQLSVARLLGAPDECETALREIDPDGSRRAVYAPTD
jgi:hypothetical protein